MPDEEQDITVKFDIVSLASFDEESCSYIIEEGDYIVRYGEDSRHTKPAAILRFDKEKITQICEHICPLDEEFEEIAAENSKNDFDPSGVDKKCYAEIINIDTDCIKTVRNEYSGIKEELIDNYPGETITLDDVRNGKRTLDELIAQLTVEEMARNAIIVTNTFFMLFTIMLIFDSYLHLFQAAKIEFFSIP